MIRSLGRRVSVLGIIVVVCVGCSLPAPYMQRWEPVTGITNRWTGGTIVASKLSADEATVFQSLGTPNAIRLFREAQTRQQVYAWIYLEPAKSVWFIDGKQVEYVIVEANNSPLTKAERETLTQKLITGGVLGATVGAVATGAIVFGEDIGLR